MFTEKELGHLLLAVIILTFIVSFKKILGNQIDYLFFLISFIFLALITLINVIAKKAAANYFESNLEIKIWERWFPFHYMANQSQSQSALFLLLLNNPKFRKNNLNKTFAGRWRDMRI